MKYLASFLMLAMSYGGASASAQAPELSPIEGIWACAMRTINEDGVTMMTGHTTYSADGRYEATGLGVVVFDNPQDQIRWAATSSGLFNVDKSILTISDVEVSVLALPPLGFEAISEENVQNLYNLIVGQIQPRPEGTSQSEIIRLDQRALQVRSMGSGHVWNCSRQAESLS